MGCVCDASHVCACVRVRVCACVRVCVCAQASWKHSATVDSRPEEGVLDSNSSNNIPGVCVCGNRGNRLPLITVPTRNSTPR